MNEIFTVENASVLRDILLEMSSFSAVAVNKNEANSVFYISQHVVPLLVAKGVRKNVLLIDLKPSVSMSDLAEVMAAVPTNTVLVPTAVESDDGSEDLPTTSLAVTIGGAECDFIYPTLIDVHSSILEHRTTTQTGASKESCRKPHRSSLADNDALDLGFDDTFEGEPAARKPRRNGLVDLPSGESITVPLSVSKARAKESKKVATSRIPLSN
jgi:hypothetical protein